MPDGSVLGTTFLEFMPDSAKLKTALDGVEKSAKDTGSKVETTLNKSFAKPVDDVTKRLKAAQGAVDQFYKTIDAGGTISARSVNRIVGQVELARSAMVQMYGSVNRGTPDAVAKFRALEASLKKVQLTARGVIDAQQDQRTLLSEGGVAWRGFNETLNVAVGKYGSLQMKVLAYTAAATAGWQIGRKIGEQTGVNYQAWDDLLTKMQTRGAKFHEWLGRMELDMLRFGSGQWGAIQQEVQDEATLKGAKYGKSSYSEDPKARAAAMKAYAESEQAISQWAAQHKATMIGFAAEAALAAHNFDLLREKTIAQLKVEQQAAEQQLLFDHYAERIPALREEYDAKRKKALTDIAKLEKEYFDTEFAHALTMSRWNSVNKDLLGPSVAMAFAKALGNVGDEMDALLPRAQTTLEKLAEMYRKNATTLQEVYASALNSVEDLFVGVLDVAITGKLNNLDDVFKSFLKDLTREIERMMAQRAVQALLSWAGKYYGTPTSTVMAASGGILRGGFQAFAGGGVVTQPTLGLVGEGRYNEAVVPLPDGESIPVQMKGGGGRGEKHEFVFSLDPGLLMAMRPTASETNGNVVISIKEGGDVFRAIDGMLRSR